MVNGLLRENLCVYRELVVELDLIWCSLELTMCKDFGSSRLTCLPHVSVCWTCTLNHSAEHVHSSHYWTCPLWHNGGHSVDMNNERRRWACSLIILVEWWTCTYSPQMDNRLSMWRTCKSMVEVFVRDAVFRNQKQWMYRVWQHTHTTSEGIVLHGGWVVVNTGVPCRVLRCRVSEQTPLSRSVS